MMFDSGMFLLSFDTDYNGWKHRAWCRVRMFYVTSMLFTVTKGHKVWLKPKALWAYKHARWKPCCCGIFCSRFHPILSPPKIILEMVFWTNLMLDLICTWLEKTRRFCRQVNKKISSCFWTASTSCVQRSSLGWCSRLTYTCTWKTGYGNRGLDSRRLIRITPT